MLSCTVALFQSCTFLVSFIVIARSVRMASFESIEFEYLRHFRDEIEQHFPLQAVFWEYTLSPKYGANRSLVQLFMSKQERSTAIIV